jgi:hypothetical protein
MSIISSLDNLKQSLTGSSPGIRNFIVGVIVKVASDETASRKEKTYLNKLNLALVQVRRIVRATGMSI